MVAYFKVPEARTFLTARGGYFAKMGSPSMGNSQMDY